MATSLTGRNISATHLPWEDGNVPVTPNAAAALQQSITGIRRSRLVTPADSTNLTLTDPISGVTTAAIARCLTIYGGTQICVVCADDDPAGTLNAGGPINIPLSGGFIILPYHVSQVWATGTTGSPTIIANY